MKDRATYTYTITEPVYQSLSQVRANMKSNPAQPIKTPGKMYVKGNFVYLNEVNRGIHVIDMSDPSHPINKGFIPIPGNQDMAVKGNTLFAGSYSDLVALDITDPLLISAKQFLDNVFPDLYAYAGSRNNPDSAFVVVGWVIKDTTVPYKNWTSVGCFNCFIIGPAVFSAASSASNATSSGSSSNGTGGSMSRFTVVNDYLYAVTNTQLSILEVQSVPSSFVAEQIPLAAGQAETVYPFSNKLFVGSTTGMLVYDISNPTSPAQVGVFEHAKSCDPVISDGAYAYITLSAGNVCNGFANELQVVDISNLTNATLVQTYAMTHPEGLAKDGNTLFVCDASAGLKVMDATDVSHMQLIAQFQTFTPYEVILVNKMAIVAASEGLFIFDYHDLSHINQIGRL